MTNQSIILNESLVVPLIIGDILHMDTQFPICMDYGLILMDGEELNQHKDSYLGLNV